MQGRGAWLGRPDAIARCGRLRLSGGGCELVLVKLAEVVSGGDEAPFRAAGGPAAGEGEGDLSGGIWGGGDGVDHAGAAAGEPPPRRGGARAGAGRGEGAPPPPARG